MDCPTATTSLRARLAPKSRHLAVAALAALVVSVLCGAALAGDKLVLDPAELGVEAVKAVTGNKKVKHTGHLTLRPGKVYEARVVDASKLTAIANRARLASLFKVKAGDTVRVRMTSDGQVILAIPTGDWCLKKRRCKVRLRRQPGGQLGMESGSIDR